MIHWSMRDHGQVLYLIMYVNELFDLINGSICGMIEKFNHKKYIYYKSGVAGQWEPKYPPKPSTTPG